MTKALGYISIAKKAGAIETGEQNSADLVKAFKAKLLVVAEDASEAATRRAEGYVFEPGTPFLKCPLTKEQFQDATGKTGCSMLAFKDTGLALAFVTALAEGGFSGADGIIEALSQKAEREKKRKSSSAPRKKTKQNGRNGK